MNIPFGTPMIGAEERDAVSDVLAGNILVHGPKAKTFEEAFAAFTQAPYAVSVSSCTAGMHLIYFTLGYGPGDEVIVPAQTHIATAHAVELTGARPIFVDVDPRTGNIDIAKIELAISPNTRAIAVVHYLGVPVDMPKIMEIALRHNLFVLEDCALSPGAKIDGIHTGLHGDAGVFSFYPVKHITTAEGGMVILKDQELAKQITLKKAFGVDRTHGERKIPGLYDAVELGFNYRMSEIHAAIGIEQVKKLPGFLRRRTENYTTLFELLGKIDEIRVLLASQGRLHSSYYCLSIILKDDLAPRRPAIMEALTVRGIGSSIYYPQPVPRMTYYRQKYGYDALRYAHAARISDNSIALPIGPHLDPMDMQAIANNLSEILKGIG